MSDCILQTYTVFAGCSAIPVCCSTDLKNRNPMDPLVDERNLLEGVEKDWMPQTNKPLTLRVTSI